MKTTLKRGIGRGADPTNGNGRAVYPPGTARTKTLSLMSFPRDLVVPIRCPGKPTFTDRINAAYSECGSRGSLETIRALTHIPINYLVTVNFRGFRQVVDQLGGVWIDVDHRL